jgi:phage protein U
MAEPNRQDLEQPTGGQESHYSATGHPSVEQLMAEQGTGPIADVSVLNGTFWPEGETIEEFLEALHECRGHKRTSPSA